MRPSVLGAAVSMLLAACTTASASSSPSCEVLQPRELLSGSPAGDPRPSADGRFEWGSGRDRLVEAVGELAADGATSDRVELPEGEWHHVSVRGADGVVVPVGDPGVGEIAIEWLAGACGYTIWLAPGATIDEAVTYAGRF